MPGYSEITFGSGPVGGKARSLVFAGEMIGESGRKFPWRVAVPTSWFIATGVFDQFMRENGFSEDSFKGMDPDEVERAFLDARLPSDLRSFLRELLQRVKYPLAVRSSSLLEDHARYSVIFTFAHLDRYYPELLRTIQALFDVLEEGMGMPVDIEFACEPEERVVYLVQARPLSQLEEYNRVTIPSGIREEDIILKGDRMLTNGLLAGVKWLVYVDPYRYQAAPDKHSVARAVGIVNEELRGERYILVGPGRWGSSHISLGVPVRYSEICNAGLLVELGIKNEGFVPELSYGTHFFADLENDRVLYLPVFDSIPTNIFREDWFFSAPRKVAAHPAVFVYRGEFSAFLDGEANIGVVTVNNG